MCSLSVGRRSLTGFEITGSTLIFHTAKENLALSLERKSGEKLHPAFTSIHCNVNIQRKCLVLDFAVATGMLACVSARQARAMGEECTD